MLTLEQEKIDIARTRGWSLIYLSTSGVNFSVHVSCSNALRR